MNTIKRTTVIALIWVLFSSSSMAHGLWVNLYDSDIHPPGHAITSLGWGHMIPMDDLLTTGAGALEIKRYDFVDPAGALTPMPLPSQKTEKIIQSPGGLGVQPGDLGVRKIILTDHTLPGTYQVLAESSPTYFTSYVDENQKTRIAAKSIDQIKGAAKINFSILYKAMAKAYMTVGEWSPPPPGQFDLEIMPASDLSRIVPGDTIAFDVSLAGKKLTCDVNEMNYLVAFSNTFGGPSKSMISGFIIDGKAKISLPTPGQWLVNVWVKKEVTPDNELKQLVGKCNSVQYGASVSLNVNSK